ncbi:hypothetical protein GF373_11420, partial [bacterium]|nr:hypothetical protein [bacterium]
MMGRRFLAVTLGVAFLCLGLMAQAQDVYMWEFNEGEGTTVTDNSGQYDSTLGALLDMPVSEEDSPSGQAGDRSVTPVGGFEVDDSDDPVLDVVEGPLTFEVWVNPNELAGHQDFFRIGNSLKAGTSGDTMLFTFLGVVDIGTGVVIPVDGNWHHLAYAWEPGVGVTYYLDGAEAEFVEETRAPRAFENQMLSIGSSHEGGSVFNGKMDRLRLHEAVLDASQLDSDAANPKALLDTTLVAYDFDETEWPYANSTDADRPATSINQRELENSYPEFSPLSPTGEEGDFSMQFDGNDRITYDDNETFFFDIIDEPFTFETWLKFNSEDQIAGRPVFLAYGRGGQGGYSFSFRPAPEQAETVEDAPSGQAGDHSIRPNSVLEISDENHPLLSLREGPMTVEAWVKPDAFPTWSDIIRIGLSLKAGFHDANLVFTLFGIADINTEVAVPVDEGWHHVAYA